LISPFRAPAIIAALAIFNCFGMTLNASADETKIRVGALDAVLTVPADVERPIRSRISFLRTASVDLGYRSGARRDDADGCYSASPFNSRGTSPASPAA
jgi:hypothetical protein